MVVDREKKLAEEASQLGALQKVVLSWDYVQILKDSASKKKVASLKRVKNVYTDVADYIVTYEPLLFEEVKAHIVRGRDEEETDWQRGAVASCGEANGFHLVSLGVLSEFGMQVSENDLLLLSREKVNSLWNYWQEVD